VVILHCEDMRPIGHFRNYDVEVRLARIRTFPSFYLHFPKNHAAFLRLWREVAAFISLLHAVTTKLESQSYIRVIALDFSKAFDSVRHSTLVDKLAQLDISDDVYNWVTQHLNNREHIACSLMIRYEH
jgi:hypothetical protein